jgi:transketolase
MRKAFVQTLIQLAEQDPRIMLLTADLGYCALEPFANRFPDRFLNVGVAEQNMIAVATGLAETGFVPYCYSIAPFAVLRPYEFIRNGPISHQLPVRIVGMGGGFDYATNGETHYALEDIGVMRTQPGISIFAPADGAQTSSVMEITSRLSGPIYYRLGKDDSLVVPNLQGRFRIGRPEHLVRGDDVLFVATGAIACEAALAVERLSVHGIAAGLAVLASINPIDRVAMSELLRSYRQVIAVEAHYTNGGLGSLLAELIAEEELPVRLVRKGVSVQPDGITGRQAFMHARYGISHIDLIDVAIDCHSRVAHFELNASAR